ncbi:minor coat protein [Thermus phage Zuza8]
MTPDLLMEFFKVVAFGLGVIAGAIVGGDW